MCTRKLIEITLFLMYWLGFGYFAVYMYYFKIVKINGWDKKPSIAWPSLAACLFILVVIYVIIRYLTLLLYARCKISEERLIAKTKQKVRAIKESSKKSASVGGSSNLTYENEKLTNQQDTNNNEFKRFLSLNNITQPIRGTIMKNGKSLDTVLDAESNSNTNHINQMKANSIEKLIDVYEKPSYEKNLKNQLQKYNKYEIPPHNENGKPTTIKKHYKSAENLLDYDKIESFNQSSSVANLMNRFENIYDVVDGEVINYSTKSLRKQPRVPQQQQRHQQHQRITATTLPRIPKKIKRMAHTPPISASNITVNQIQQQNLSTKPPLPKTKPILIKNFLVSNARV